MKFIRTLKKLRFALFAPSQCAQLSVALVFGALLLWGQLTTDAPAFGVLSSLLALDALFLGVTIWGGLRDFEEFQGNYAQASAARWIMKGATAAEIQARSDLWESGDSAAMASAGFSAAPLFNVDGTPMIGDSGVDINGNALGITEDTFATDMSTGMLMDTTSAYSEPHNM